MIYHLIRMSFALIPLFILSSIYYLYFIITFSPILKDVTYKIVC